MNTAPIKKHNTAPKLQRLKAEEELNPITLEPFRLKNRETITNKMLDEAYPDCGRTFHTRAEAERYAESTGRKHFIYGLYDYNINTDFEKDPMRSRESETGARIITYYRVKPGAKKRLTHYFVSFVDAHALRHMARSY